MDLLGLHHLTAITADVKANYRFYTQVLGLRLVKRSVNQDDVTAYHLFYADGAGNPGTDITFFDWAMPSEQRGTRGITRTGFRVNGLEALAWWERHLREAGVKSGPIFEWDGRGALNFEDPEGQRLALVDDGGQSPAGAVWDRSIVPAEYQIRGLGPVVMSVPELRRTEQVLIHALNMKQTRQYVHPDSEGHAVHVFEMAGGGPHAELHVAVQPELNSTRQGAGGVHHVAFRTPNETEYHAWTQRLSELGIRHSGEIDRYWFRSLYFREPAGILFEIATDGPGFSADEDPATLGEKVSLPPFLEPNRDEIVSRLKPIE